MLDADNLQANIFLGNYYYLQAEKDKKKLEEDYKKDNFPHKDAVMHAIATDCQTCSPIATARLRHTCNACFRYSPPWSRQYAGKDKEDGAGAEIAVRIPTNRKGLFVSYFSPVSFNLFRYSEGMQPNSSLKHCRK